MARARNIKPGFYANEDLAECSIWARFIFPGLWMLADREGRLEDRPKRIKGALLPFDGQDVEPLLRELEARGFILRYQSDGAACIQISKFLTHQAPHYSEKKSVIKPPTLPEIDPHIEPANSRKPPPIKRGSQPPDSLNPSSLNPDSPKKAEATRSRGSRLPPDWELSKELAEWAINKRPDLDPSATAERFRDHWIAQPGSRGVKTDWAATWRNWVRGESGRINGKPPVPDYADTIANLKD